MATTPTVPAAEIMLKTSELDVFIPELWADSIRASFKKQLKLAPLSTDYSALFSGGGDKVHIPTYQDVADAATKAEGTPVNYAVRDEVALNIEINRHQYTSCMIDDLPVVQSSNELFSGYADSMAYKLALAFDANLEAELQSTDNGILIGSTASVADTAETLGKNSIADIWTAVIAQNVNPAECILVLGNKLYSSLFLLDGFIHVSKTGVSDFGSAQVGSLMDMPVLHTTSITGAVAVASSLTNAAGGAVDNDEVIGGYVVHRDALGHAFSKRPTVNAKYDMDYIAHKMVSDAIYGARLLQNSTYQKKCWGLIETGVTAF